MAILHKNNVDKLVATVETVEKKLNEISTYLSKEAKYGGEEEVERSENFNYAIKKGKEAAISFVIEEIRDAINNDPSKFIRSIKDLELDSSSSYVNDVDDELHQLLHKSLTKQSFKPGVEFARSKLWAKDIDEQRLAFIGKIDYPKTKVAAREAEAARLLLEYVWKPALAKGSIDPATAKEILQNALDKLTSSNWQTPGGAQGTPEAQGNKGGATETQVEAKYNNQEQNQKQIPGSATKVFVEEAATSELLALVSEREKKIEDSIRSIKKADPVSLQKENVEILQWGAELQAMLKKVPLSKEQREKLQALQNDLNKAVEEKAKELNVGTKTLTVSDKHLKATEEHIDNLMKRKETEYEEVITNYHNTVIEIFAEVFNIPKESIDKIIDETLDERIKRHTALGEVLRKISNEESQNLNLPPPEGFNINSLNQNK